MKKIQNKKALSSLIGIIAGALVLCISVVSYSFAWFRKIDGNSVTGLDIKVIASDVGSVTIAAHPVTKIETSSNNVSYTFDSTLTAKEIPVFDEYGLEKAEYECAVVLEITVAASIGSRLDIKSLASDPWHSTVTVITEGDRQGHMIDSLSNGISFYPVDTVNSNIVTVDSTNEKTFVTMSGSESAPSFNKEGTISLNNGGVPYVITEKITTFYFVLTYNNKVMKYITERASEYLLDHSLVTKDGQDPKTYFMSDLSLTIKDAIS